MARRIFAMLIALGLSVTPLAMPVGAAGAFANPAFEQQWQQGEATTSNFWGPLANATNGVQEQYLYSGTNKSRLVQYFDKGRMELYGGVTSSPTPMVTNGLLATELIKGQIQIADDQFQAQAPPAIPMAGDPDNPSPTYAQLSTTANSLLAAAPAKIGNFVSVMIDASGAVTDGGGFAGISMTPPIGVYDSATQHNVLGVFADYRSRVSLATIGLAISEPFRASVKVAGTDRTVIIQVLERRVLTYTFGNTPAFLVEMGNIGKHYYQWRYPNGPPSTASSGPTAASPAPITSTTGNTIFTDPQGRFSFSVPTSFSAVNLSPPVVIAYISINPFGPNFSVQVRSGATDASVDAAAARIQQAYTNGTNQSGPSDITPLMVGGQPARRYTFYATSGDVTLHIERISSS